MSFLKSLYFKSNQAKTVVITVTLPQDKSLMRPRQGKESYDHHVAQSKTLEEDFKLNQIQVLPMPGEDHTLSTDLNTSSEHTLSSKDMDSLNEDDLDYNIGEMSLSGSGGSSCSSSFSSLSLDERDDVENTEQDASSDSKEMGVNQTHENEGLPITPIPDASSSWTPFESSRKLIPHL